MLGEDPAREPVDPLALELEHVGGAVDDGLDQPGQDRLAGQHHPGRPRRPVHEHPERLRIVVAHRGELVVAQDEGDAGEHRVVGIDPAQQSPGHVAGAVLDIEEFRGLDVLHLLPGRDRDAEERLDLVVLLAGRLDQVDPERVRRDRLGRFEQAPLEERLTGAGAGIRLMDEDQGTVSGEGGKGLLARPLEGSVTARSRTPRLSMTPGPQPAGDCLGGDRLVVSG